MKSHLKDVNAILEKQRKTVLEKRRKRVLTRLTAPKSLGHGKFEDFKEPVLLPTELNGTLRGLKSTGTSILQGKRFILYFLFLDFEKGSKSFECRFLVRVRFVSGKYSEKLHSVLKSALRKCTFKQKNFAILTFWKK